jgi:hypothetical protein
MAERVVICDDSVAAWLHDHVGYLFDQGSPIRVTAVLDTAARRKKPGRRAPAKRKTAGRKSTRKSTKKR